MDNLSTDGKKLTISFIVLVALLLLAIILREVRNSALAASLNSLRSELVQTQHENAAQLKANVEALARQGSQLDIHTTRLEELKVVPAALTKIQSEQRSSAEKWNEQRVTLDQQTAILNRAIGKFIPIELPPTLREQISALNTRLSDKNTWPKTDEESQALTQELKQLLKTVPPWAEEEILPQINAMRWNLVAATVLQRAASNLPEEIISFVEQAQLALSSAPDEGSVELGKLLEAEIENANQRMARIRRMATLKQVEVALKDEKATLAQVASALDAIEAIGFQVGDQKDIEEKGRLLRAKFVVLNSLRVVDEVDRVLKAAEVENLAVVRQSKLGQAMEAALGARTDLSELIAYVPAKHIHMLDGRIASIQAAFDKESERAKQIESAKVRDYQRWALQKLEAYRIAMDFAEKADKGLINSPNYGYIRDAMIRHLVPIAPQYLEQGVARLYNEAYDRGWRQLDGKSEKLLQLDVAKAEASAVKNKP